MEMNYTRVCGLSNLIDKFEVSCSLIKLIGIYRIPILGQGIILLNHEFVCLFSSFDNSFQTIKPKGIKYLGFYVSYSGVGIRKFGVDQSKTLSVGITFQNFQVRVTTLCQSKLSHLLQITIDNRSVKLCQNIFSFSFLLFEYCRPKHLG